MSAMKKTILTAIDFSPVSDVVCGIVINLARSLRARVVLLYAVETPFVPDDLGLMSQYAVPLAEAAEKAAHRGLARRKRRFQAAAIPVEIVCVRGPAAAAILEESERRHVDWIVLGSHGHNAAFDLLVGSTAHRVLTKAQCPVIVVPAISSCPPT
jgi:nucleotide-binding universal stress UspA family protein